MISLLLKAFNKAFNEALNTNIGRIVSMVFGMDFRIGLANRARGIAHNQLRHHLLMNRGAAAIVLRHRNRL